MGVKNQYLFANAGCRTLKCKLNTKPGFGLHITFPGLPGHLTRMVGLNGEGGDNKPESYRAG